MSKSTAYGLLLAGGIITLVVAVVVGLIGAALSVVPMTGAMIGAFSVWGIIVGLLMIFGAYKIKKNRADAHT